MRKLVLVAALVLMAGGAQAATLNVIGGILHGASDVLVDGSLYDVQFLDGTCIGLYNGCDAVTDFTFQTEASATLASQALLDQVLVDGVDGQFDSTPGLMNPERSFDVARYIITPFGYLNCGFTLPVCGMYAANGNQQPFVMDAVHGPIAFLPHVAASTGLAVNSDVFAVWSVVPEPSTALLFGLGLTGLASKACRRNRS